MQLHMEIFRLHFKNKHGQYHVKDIKDYNKSKLGFS